MIHLFNTDSGFKLFIKNKEVKRVFVDKNGVVSADDPWDIELEEIWENDVVDFPNNLEISTSFYNKLTDGKDFLRITKSANKNLITIYVDHVAERWDHPWNLKNFLIKLKQVVESEDFNNLNLDSYSEGADGFFGYSLVFPLPEEGRLKTIIIQYLRVMESIYKKAFELLDKEISNTGARFMFPPHLSNACEQYLSYFRQFLSDLDVETNTELKKIGNEIIFSVTPRNKNEALHKIHQALQVFLLFPSFSENQEFSLLENTEETIKTQRLLSTINHLKSQLNLANALNCALNERVNNILEYETSSILIKYLNETKVNGESKDKVEFFRGIVEIGKYETNGFSINFPKLITEIKKLTKKS